MDKDTGDKTATAAAGLEHIDTTERGATIGEQRQTLDRRLFMQLLVLRAPSASRAASLVAPLQAALQAAACPAVIYADVNDPAALGLLSWSEAPAHFATTLRTVLADPRFEALRPDPAFSMLGRSYSTGHEPNLAYWLLDKPKENVLREDCPWAVWYPLRRHGSFEKLSPRDKGSILKEHGMIGRAYGAQDLAHDVRLACHGLDLADNEFVIGLIGKELFPLSHVVQRMRSTRQTSEFIAKMGPFFIGHVVARVP
ncbi:MAG: chlorite dismutase family protein [Polyangiales bacterium]